MAGESEFYKRHYGGSVAIGATELDIVDRDMLAPGKRYGLVVEGILSGAPPYGCIAEVGCGGGEALLCLSRRFQFKRMVGVEIAASARKQMLMGVEFLSGNLNEVWPFEDREVDHLI